jgi:osmotically-inducible protein OsmY
MRIQKFLSLVVVVMLAGWVGACENTKEGLEKDAEINTEKASEQARDAQQAAGRAADRAVEETRDAANAVADATREGADKAANAAREAGSVVDAARQTAEIKTALIADKSIVALHIDVDTDAATKTVTLKGSVPTAAQKMAAEKVAREKAPAYTVVNQLTIKG